LHNYANKAHCRPREADEGQQELVIFISSNKIWRVYTGFPADDTLAMEKKR
jgi:hypothetical protein